MESSYRVEEAHHLYLVRILDWRPLHVPIKEAAHPGLRRRENRTFQNTGVCARSSRSGRGSSAARATLGVWSRAAWRRDGGDGAGASARGRAMLEREARAGSWRT